MYAAAKSGYYAKTLIYHGYLAAIEPARRSAKYFALSFRKALYLSMHVLVGIQLI